MGFTNLHLPEYVIASLYKDDLVVMDSTKTKANKPAPPKKDTTPEKPLYLGSNLQHILILVNDANAVHVDDESLNFLTNIIQACKKNLGDVAIVNLAHHPLKYTALKEKLSPKYMLLFDIHPTTIQLPFAVPNYQLQQFDDCQFLFASALQSMIANTQEAKLEKSKLWLSLKKMFNL
jgi:hypothetical protein